MPVWNFATKSVQAFFNFSFGQYFSQPLREDQVIVTTKGVGCKDVYFNIEKLNAIVAERGIPFVLCVAYVAEIIVCLPWSIEVRGIDFVIQAVSGKCSPAKNDDLLNSMLSSMTAAAFAAAKVVHGVDHWPNIDTDIYETATEAKGGGLWSWVQSLFEKMTSTLEEEVNFEKDTKNPLVDFESKKRLALMLDSLIAHTTVILHDVTIRIECQLGLPNMDRASSLTICLGKLLLTNQQSSIDPNLSGCQAGRDKTDDKSDFTNPLSSGQAKDEGWSWFRWWRRKPADPLVTTSTGSLFTMMHKIVHLDSADIFWDLWDTSRAGQSDLLESRPDSSVLDTPELDHSEAADFKLPRYGPTTENVVASGKLLSLSGGDNIARISMCCPLLSALTSGDKPTPDSSSAAASQSTSEPNQSFQLRLYLDIGPVVACTCPSQFYWLRLMLGQLVRISEDYAEQVRVRAAEQPLDSQVAMKCRQIHQIPGWQPGYQALNHLPQMGMDLQRLNSYGSVDSDLVDLDLTALPHDGESVSMIESKLFWSCVTDEPVSQEMTFVDMESSTATTDTMIHGDPVQQDTKSKSQFSLAANVLSTALIVFYDDESLSSSPSRTDATACGHLGELGQLTGNNNSSLFRSVIGPSPATIRSREHYDSASPATGNDQVDDKMEQDVDNEGHDPNEESVFQAPPTDLPAGTSAPASANNIDVTALPGPSLFFARYHGFLPWRQVLSGKSSDSDKTEFTARPMRTDREEVDTGRMNPAGWVAHLRRQFAELAAPRDHICLVGGLWRVEMCSRSLTSTTTRPESVSTVTPIHGHSRSGHPVRHGLSRPNGGTQLNINAQLFGVEISECLFEETGKDKVTATDAQPVFVELLTFPDRLRTGSDRLIRASGDPAIEVNLLLHLHSSEPVSFLPNRQEQHKKPAPSGSLAAEPPCNKCHIQLAFCRLEVDISLSDRLHRVMDALAAAGEAVFKWMPVSTCASDNSSPSRSKIVTTNENILGSYAHWIVNNMTVPHVSTGSPTPLQEPSQTLSDLRSKLWSSGTPFWLPTSAADSTGGRPGLAWWRRTLRPEYLRICLDKLTFTYQVVLPYQTTFSSSFFKRASHRTGDGKMYPSSLIDDEESGKQTTELSLHCISVWLCENDPRYQHTEPFLRLSADGRSSDLITISLSVAQPGRQELIEQSNSDPSMANYTGQTQYDQVYPTSAQQQHFEVGIDLTRTQEVVNSQGADVEWLLWKRVGPKQNRRTPLVLCRNFLQDAIKAHSKQTTYYPGDSNHMEFYRRSASSHTWLSLKCHIPAANINVTSKRLVDVLYCRVMYDLLLWSSLLPNDRRLRATLARYHHESGGRPRQDREIDHRYWFLSDPAPLASIYAHPEAAREAAKLEATTAHNCDLLHSQQQYPGGLHFLPMESDNDDEYDGGLETTASGCTRGDPSRSRRDSRATAFIYDGPSRSGAQHNSAYRRSRCNSLAEDQLEGEGEGQTTAVQRQSLMCIYVNVAQMEACVTLPRIGNAAGVDDFVHMSANHADFFVEVGHNGEMDVNYATTEVAGFNVYFTANHQRTNAQAQHQPRATDPGQVWWPGLVDISSNPLGFPAKSSASGAYEGSVASSGGNSIAGPVLSLAVEHRHSRHMNSGGNGPGCLDDFVLALRLQNACLVHWPSLDLDVCRPCAGGLSEALPLWLSRLLRVIETPSVDCLSELLPSYLLPDTLLIQHIHLERIAFVWSHRDSLVSPGLVGQPAASCSGQTKSDMRRHVRGLMTVESVSLTLNSVSETVPNTDGDCQPADLIKPTHGMLIMAFLTNAAVFLCPVSRNFVSSLFPSALDVATSLDGSVTTAPSAIFSKWLQTLDLSECVCVIDLDHLEARCFFDTMKTNSPEGMRATYELVRLIHSFNCLHSPVLSWAAQWETPSLVNRVDLRATNNLLRMSACADSLALLQCLTESLYSSQGASRCATCLPSGNPVGSTTVSTNHSVDDLSCDSIQKASLEEVGSNIQDLLLNAISDDNTETYEGHAISPSISSANTVCQKSTPGRSQSRVNALHPPTQPFGGRLGDGEISPTLSDEFVIISSDCVISKGQQLAEENIERVLVFVADSSAYTIVDNFYALPNTSGSQSGRDNARRSHSRHLFVDPPAVYPRANLAITLYNFSLEWNLYGGHDFAISGLPSMATEHIFSSSPVSTGSDTGSDVRPLPVKPSKGSESPRADAVSGLSIPTRVPSGYRFRHDRSATLPGTVSLNTVRSLAPASPSPVNAYQFCGQSPQDIATELVTSLRSRYNGGGKNRDLQQAISICLGKIYFRHAAFPLGALPKRQRQSGHDNEPAAAGPRVSDTSSCRGQPASRHILNIGSVVVLDQVATSNINQMLYTYVHPLSGCPVPHDSRTPVFRAAVVCHRIVTEIDPTVVGQAASSDKLSLELEAQVSVQPLRINLDQNTLFFLNKFKQSFANECSLLLSLPHESGQTVGNQTVGTPSFPNDPQLTVPSPLANDAGKEISSIFIRKVTFYPDLPIRLDYHGRKLDLSLGSLHGVLQMLLQINNGVLVIPRRVYQRGYPTVEKLIEEIIDDLRNTVKSQLPQMLVTSIGPMHEVSHFIQGLWDLIYQPIQSVYHSARPPDIRGFFTSPAGSQMDLSDYEGKAILPSPTRTGGTTAFMHGLKRGTRSFSASTLWAALQLSIQGVRAVQSVAETAYDLVTPGPALRSRQLRLRQPADLREGFGNAVTAMNRGFQMVTDDLCGATRLAEVDVTYGVNKGPVGIVGDVLRQLPPTIVAPMVTGCEVTANILGGFRNQLHPEAKLEDEQKWKDTHGL